MIKLYRNYDEWWTVSPLLSFNASLYIILATRNIGKTWSLKLRSLIRGAKKHKKSIWVRMFVEERDNMIHDFLSPKLIKQSGLDPERFVQLGKRIYYNFGDKSCKNINDRKHWDWIISAEVLSQHRTLKSADDPQCDTLVFDEFLTDREHLAFYRGNWVTDIQQLMVTVGRDHDLKTFLLGNKDIVSNGLFKALGIKIDKNYQGIKTYCEGEVVVEQVNDVPKKVADHYQKHLGKIFKKTGFDKYLTGGAFNEVSTDFIERLPNNVTRTPLVSFYIDKHKCTAVMIKNKVWIREGINPNGIVIADRQTKYGFSYMYTSPVVKDILKMLKEKREFSLIRFENESALDSYTYAITKCKV